MMRRRWAAPGAARLLAVAAACLLATHLLAVHGHEMHEVSEDGATAGLDPNAAETLQHRQNPFAAASQSIAWFLRSYGWYCVFAFLLYKVGFNTLRDRWDRHQVFDRTRVERLAREQREVRAKQLERWNEEARRAKEEREAAIARGDMPVPPSQKTKADRLYGKQPDKAKLDTDGADWLQGWQGKGGKPRSDASGGAGWRPGDLSRRYKNVGGGGKGGG